MLQIFRFHHRSSVHPNAIEGDESCPDAVCFNSCTLTHAFFHMTPRRRTHAHTYARCLQATERPQRPQPASYLRCPGAFERLRVISPDPESQMSLNMRGFNREEVLFFLFSFFSLRDEATVRRSLRIIRRCGLAGADGDVHGYLGTYCTFIQKRHTTTI